MENFGFGHRFGQKPSFSVRECSDALGGKKLGFLAAQSMTEAKTSL